MPPNPDHFPTTSLILPIVDALRNEILDAVTHAGPAETHTIAACKAAIDATINDYLFHPEQTLNRMHARRAETAKDVFPRLVSRALRKLMTLDAINDAVANTPIGDFPARMNEIVAAMRDPGMTLSESQAHVREGLEKLAKAAKGDAPPLDQATPYHGMRPPKPRKPLDPGEAMLAKAGLAEHPGMTVDEMLPDLSKPPREVDKIRKSVDTRQPEALAVLSAANLTDVELSELREAFGGGAFVVKSRIHAASDEAIDLEALAGASDLRPPTDDDA